MLGTAKESKDEFISDVLLWTITSGHTLADQQKFGERESMKSVLSQIDNATYRYYKDKYHYNNDKYRHYA